MSVTFTIQDAPEVEEWIECSCSFNLGKPSDDCPICEGRGGQYYMEAAPGYSANMGNSTARMILQIMGIEVENLCGSISLDEMPEVRRRIIKAFNTDAVVDAFVVPPSYRAGGHAGVSIEQHENRIDVVRMGAPCHNMGISNERIRRNLKSIDKLVALAQKKQKPISFG